VTLAKRSNHAPQSEKNRDVADAARTDQGPLWLIALPSFACTVLLAGYLLTIGSHPV
jgi:hypothetical protein